MGELAQTLNAQRQLFTSLHPYPLPSFPGNTQEGLLQQLLRKKPEPRAEEWIDETLKIDAEEEKAENGVSATRGAAASPSDEETRDLWGWAGATTAGKVQEMLDGGLFDDDYSIKERKEGVKNVVTGLKRQLDDSSSAGGTPKSEDVKMEDEDESKEDQKLIEIGLDPSKSPMPLEQLLRLESGA